MIRNISNSDLYDKPFPKRAFASKCEARTQMRKLRASGERCLLTYKPAEPSSWVVVLLEAYLTGK